MKRFYIALVLNIIITTVSYSQTDSVKSAKYCSTRYTPRFGLGYQKYGYFELGICRQLSIYTYPNTAGYYSGLYLSNEFIINKSKIICGPKIGYENMRAGNIAWMIGFEMTQYFDNKSQNFVLTPRVFLPLTRQCTPLLFFSYGYNFCTTSDFRDLIGRHKFSIIFNLNFKDHRNINNLLNRKKH